MKTIQLTLLLSLLWSGTAAADAIRPRPIDCPPGSRKRNNHCGTRCVAWACSDKGTCADGRQCRSTRLCILSGMRRACGRGALRHKDKKFPYSKVIGACDGDTKCAAGSTCVEAKRCVPEPKPKVEPKPKDKPKDKPKAKTEDDDDDDEDDEEEEDEPAAKAKKSKKSSCSVASPSMGGGLLLLLLLALRRRRLR